jgi:hypothetical protein
MRLGQHRCGVRAVAAGQLGAQLLDQLQGLGLPALRGEHPHQQRRGRLVGRDVRDEPPQIRLVEPTGAGQRGLGPQRREIREEPGDLGRAELRNLREQRPGLVGRGPGGQRVTRGPRLLDQHPYGDRVDVHPVGGHPVTTGHGVHRHPEPAHPRDQGLQRTGGIVGRAAPPDRLGQRHCGDRPAPRVDQLPHQGGQPLTTHRLPVDGQHPQRGDRRHQPTPRIAPALVAGTEPA